MTDTTKFTENAKRVKKFIDAAHDHNTQAEKWRKRGKFWMERGEFEHAHKCFDVTENELAAGRLRLRMAQTLLNRMK